MSSLSYIGLVCLAVLVVVTMTLGFYWMPNSLTTMIIDTIPAIPIRQYLGNASKPFDQVISNKTLQPEASVNASGITMYDGSKYIQTRVLLLTYYRGGSSFLGNMFGVNKNAFYWFEPLHFTHSMMLERSSGDGDYAIIKNGSLRPLPETITRVRTDTIASTLQCDVKLMDNRLLLDLFMKNGQHMPKMRNYTKCLKQNSKPMECLQQIRKPCASSSVVAVKTIRYPMYLVKALIEKIPDLKIVHYIRDPRGIISSRKRIHNYQGTVVTKHASILCRKMAMNYRIFTKLQSMQPGNYYLLKYEDLAVNPMETSEALYNFLGKAYPENLRSWIEINTNAKKADWDYGTKRNSKQTVFKWQSTLSLNDKTQINSKCKDTLKLLGYDHHL